MKKFIQLLVIALLFFVQQVSAKNKSLDQLRKETIYVLVPANWPDTIITQTFGNNFRKLDTSFKTVNNDVHRLGIDQDFFDVLPQIRKYYPAIEELIASEYSENIPVSVSGFTHLRSIKACYRYYPYYVSDDIPMPGPDYSVPGIILQAPLLEEASVDEEILILPEALSQHPAMKVKVGRLTTLPLFVLQKKARIDLEIDNPDIPYPEILAMSYAGFTFKDHAKTWYDELDWISPALDLYDYDYLKVPFWFEGDTLVKRPKSKPLPRNGHYSTSYFNGTNIISGNMLDGQPNGEWKWFYADGKLCEVRNYDHGKENGKWALLDPGGDTLRIFMFDEGKMISDGYFENRHSPVGGDSTRINHSMKETILDLRTLKHTIVDESYCERCSWDTLTHIAITYCDTAKWRWYTPVKVVALDYYLGKRQNKIVITVIHDSLRITEWYDGNDKLVKRRHDFMTEVKDQYNHGNWYNDSCVDSSWYANGVLASQQWMNYQTSRYRQSKWDSAGTLIMEGYFSIGRTGYGDTTNAEFRYYSNGKLTRKDVYNKWRDRTITIYDGKGEETELWYYSAGNLYLKIEYDRVSKLYTRSEYTAGVLVTKKTMPYK